MTRSFRILSAWTVIAFIFLPAVIAADKAIDPCTLLTQAEIQAALGKPMQAGKLNAGVNPAVGSNCNYIVADFGSFNVLLKPLGYSETPERIKAQFVKMKMKPVDLPNVGDSSFFTSPGFGMTQLQTFKGSRYILFTLLVPGLKEPAQQAAAAKLMRTLLSRIK